MVGYLNEQPQTYDFQKCGFNFVLLLETQLLPTKNDQSSEIQGNAPNSDIQDANKVEKNIKTSEDAPELADQPSIKLIKSNEKLNQDSKDLPDKNGKPSKAKAEEIEVLDIFVEKSRTIGLGQRLLWHMDKFNRQMPLSKLIFAKELYLTAINVRTKGAKNATIDSKVHNPKKEYVYTEQSNTIFYYNDYRVLLLLDFSQSTTAVYPTLSNSYMLKMQRSIEAVLNNLLFELPNKLRKEKKSNSIQAAPKGPFGQMRRIQSVGKQLTQKIAMRESEDSGKDMIRGQLAFSAIEEQSESGMASGMNSTTPGLKKKVSKIGLKKNFGDHSLSEVDAPDQSINQDFKKKEPQKKPQETAVFSPRIYLSIVISGLPPDNSLQLIVQNQKLDKSNLPDLMKTITHRLSTIEHTLKKQIAKKQPTDDLESQGSLQAHLYNAQYVLDLMNQDAKPLLVFFTDCTNSLFQLHQTSKRALSSRAKERLKKSQFTFGMKWAESGQLDAQIHKLHLNDAQIISIDLQEQNRICNNFGYLAHESSLKYWTLITQGVNFTYSQLMAIYDKQKEMGMLIQDKGRKSKKAVDKNQILLADQMIVKRSSCLFAIDGKSLVIQDRNEALSKVQSSDLQRSHTQGVKALQSQIDQFINPLQKLMYGRACNYGKFRQSEEIRNFLQDDFHIPQQQIKTQASKYPQSDLNLSELLLNNKFCPLLKSESLAEYVIKDVNFTSILEFRSRMGFKFLQFEYDFIRQSESPKFQQISAELAEGESIKPQSLKVIKSVEYQYWIDTFNFITCTLTVVPSSNKDTSKSAKKHKSAVQSTQTYPTVSNQSSIMVKYVIFAPNDTLQTIRQSANNPNRRANQNPEDSLYKRVSALIMSIYKKDNNFCLLDSICMQLQKTGVLFSQHSQSKDKYKMDHRSRITSKQLPNLQFQDEEREQVRTKAVDQAQLIPPEKKKKLKKITQIIDKPEQAKAFLHENRKVWDQLAALMGSQKQIYQWKVYFRYQMIAIVTHSNRKVPESNQSAVEDSTIGNLMKFVDPNIEEIWQQDQKIEAKIFHAISQFTTLTLDRSTFVQVFHEHLPQNLYARLREQFFKSNTKVTEIDSQINEVQSELSYSYCLIRLNWVSANIAECHFGFYQVNPKQRMHFLKAFQQHISQCRHSQERGIQRQRYKSSFLTRDSRIRQDDSRGSLVIPDHLSRREFPLNEDGIGFQCFLKNITSLLLRPSQTRIQRHIARFKQQQAKQMSEESENDKSPVKLLNQSFFKKSFNKETEEQEASNDSEDSADDEDETIYQEKSAVPVKIEAKLPDKSQVALEKKPLEMLLFNDLRRSKQHTKSDLERLRFRFSKFGLNADRAEIFYMQNWEWVNQNINISLQFFQRVLNQRLKDGFVMVNRYNETSDYYHMIKVIQGEKVPRPVKKDKKDKGKPDMTKYEQTNKVENVDIMLQYLISVEIRHIDEKGKLVKYRPNKQRQSVSVVRAELYMERETCFFPVNRKPDKSVAAPVKKGLMSQSSSNINAAHSRGNSFKEKNENESKTSQKQTNQTSESDPSNIKFVNGKDFFEMVADYLSKVDEFLKSNIFAYHQIVKNSMLKQIQSNDLVLQGKERKLTTELCYFRNINARTRRQRRTLENLIRQKMSFIYKDWSCYLKQQYPELFEPQVMLQNVSKNPKDSESKMGVMPVEIANDKSVIEDQFGSFKIEQLVENSKQIAVQNLHMPLIQKGLTAHEVANMRKYFQAKLCKVFDSFYDFKISCDKYAYLKANRRADFYCKLISKQILLLVEVPTSELASELIEAQGFIEVKYRRFDLTMINMDNLVGAIELQSRLGLGPASKATFQKRGSNMFQTRFFPNDSRKIDDSSKLLTGKNKPFRAGSHTGRNNEYRSQPNLLQQQLTVSPLDAWGKKGTQKLITKESLISGFPKNADDSDAVEARSAVSETDSRLKEAQESAESSSNRNQTSIYFNEEFDSDQEVEQIDQDEVYRAYFDFFYKYIKKDQKLEFETKVNRIVRNFVNFIQTSYEKIFAQVVLMSFQQRRQNDEKQTQKVFKRMETSRSSNNSDRSRKCQDLKEFNKAKKAMGCVAFKLDLNFAFVIYSQLASIEDRKHFMKLIETATDQSFKLIIERNFFKCIKNQPSYLFKENEADAVLAKRGRQTTLQPSKSEIIHQNLDRNLQQTPDAYSDSDDEEKSAKKQETTKKMDITKMYASCRKLVLEIRAIIKDAKGNILDSRPLHKFSDLFKLAFSFKDQLIPALVEKAKAQEMSNRLLNYDRFNATDGSSQALDVVEIPDNDVSIQLETKFYSVAKYIGLIGQSEIDLFSETQQPLLVNQDKQEDLINAVLFSQLQQDLQSVQGLIFKQPLFRQLKKTQITKTIPTVFKHENTGNKHHESDPDSDFVAHGEHRIFLFNDIQRRTIYGFLRRMYAVIGENVLEMLTLNRRQEKLSLQLAQKYFGYLLHYQRITHRVEVFEAYDLKRFKNLPLEVGYELRKSTILHTGYILRDAATKIDDFHNTVFYLSNAKENVYGLPKKWDQGVGPSVPFWAMFAVECNANQGIFMNFLIFIPQCKLEENFTSEAVLKYIGESASQIRLKVKKLLLLQDVLSKNKLSPELKLAFPPDQYKAILESFEEERRKKADEDSRKQREIDEKKRSEISQQPAQPQKQIGSKPTSKIGQRFKKMATLSNMDQSTIDQSVNAQSILDSTQSQNVSSVSVAQSLKTDVASDLKSPKFVKVTTEMPQTEQQDSKKFCVLENFPNSMRIFETSHRLSGQDALAKIAETLQNYSIEGLPNVYVFQNDKVINIMRISYLGTKMTEDEIEAAKEQNLPTVRETERLLVEIQGIEEPQSDQIRFMYHEIQRTITEETMKNISSAVFKNDKKLSRQDISYIKGSETKFLLLYPIDARLYDKLALLRYFKQSATRRFLMEIELETKKLRTRRVEMGEKQPLDEESIKRSMISNKSVLIPDHTDSSEGHFVQWNSQDNQLLFNFKNSFKDEKSIILGTFLGDSLALVNFSMLEDRFDRAKLEEHIKAKTGHQEVLQFMDMYQQTSFQVEPSQFEKNMNELMVKQNSSFGYRHEDSTVQSTLDLFSIPAVYHTLGEHEEGVCQPFKKFEENRFGIDKRLAAPDKGIYWMQMQVSVQGQLKHDIFIKNLTLTLNQSIYDCMIELFLDKHFVSRRIAPIQTKERDQGFKLKLNVMASEQTIADQKIKQQLGQLFNSSLACHSPISDRFKSPLKGVVSEINQSFSFALLKKLHKLMRDEISNEMQTKLAQAFDPFQCSAIINQMASLVMLIIQIDQKTRSPIKMIAYKFPLDVDFQTRKYYEGYQKFLKADQTTLRGIEVHFTTILGSFSMALSLENLNVFVPFDCSMAAFESYDLSVVAPGSRIMNYRALSINRSPEVKNSLLLQQDSLINSQSPGSNSLLQVYNSPNRHFSLSSPYSSPDDPKQMKQQRQTLFNEALQVLNKLKRSNQIEIKTQICSPAMLEQQKLEQPPKGQPNQDDNASQDKLVYSRNFFLVLNYGKHSISNSIVNTYDYSKELKFREISKDDASVISGATESTDFDFVMDCFNFSKDKFDDLKSIVQHMIIWLANRQDCLQRITSQKLGTLYSLPQFYESPKIIKTASNLKQVYNAQNIYFTQQIPLITKPEIEKPKIVKQKEEAARLSPSKQLRKSKIKNKQNAMTADPRQLTKQEAKLAKEQRRQERKQRRKDRKREQSNIEPTQVPFEFDPRQAFKRYYDDLFNDEPKLKTLNFIREQGVQEITRPSMPQRPGMRTPLQTTSFIQDQNMLSHHRGSSPHMQNSSFVSKAPNKQNASFNSTRPQVNEQKRNTIKFKDLIGFKIQNQDWSYDQQLMLSEIYLIAPTVQPTIMNDIQNLINKRSQQKDTAARKQKGPNGTTDGESLVPSIQESATIQIKAKEWAINQTLVKNPILFHGLQARHNLKCMFAQLENVQKLAVINKQANDNNDTDIDKFLKKSDKDKQLRDILERMALGMKKNNHDLHQNALSMLLEKSRLVYSGVTIKLFNRIAEGLLPLTKLGQRTETILEDDEFSLSRHTSEASNTMKRSITESEKVTDAVSIQIIQQFFDKFSEEQFRREFQIRKLFTPTPHQLRVIKEITRGEKKTPNNARLARMSNMHKSTTLQNQLRWTTINEKSPELNMSQRSRRSNQFLDDQPLVKSTSSNAFADLVGQSSRQLKHQDSQDSTRQTINIFGYQNVDQMPQTSTRQTNNLAVETMKSTPDNSLDNHVKFAIKSANNNQIVLYLIQIVRRQLQFSCYVYEDIFGSIPTEIQSFLQLESLGSLGNDFSLYKSLVASPEHLAKDCQPCLSLPEDLVTAIETIAQKKQDLIRIVANNEMALTTGFKTHSFCYDFHLSTILRQVQQSTLQHKTSQQLNLSKTLHYFVSCFQQFPTNASNFIKEIKLRINIGQINPHQFLRYFAKQIESLGYTKANLRPHNQKVFTEKTQNFPFIVEADDDENLAFYIKNKAHEQSHLSSASQKSPKPKKTDISVSQHFNSRLDEQLFNYHRLFLVEKLDESLHGSFDKEIAYVKQEKKQTTNNEIGKSQQVSKPPKRLGFGYFNQSQANDMIQNSFYQTHYELSKYEKQALSHYKRSLLKPFEQCRIINSNKDSQAHSQISADLQVDNSIEFILYVIYVRDSAPQVSLSADENARFMQKRMDTDISHFSDALLTKVEACIEDFQRESAWQQFYIQSQRETEIHKDIVKKLLQLSWKTNIQDVSDRLKMLLSLKKFDAEKLLNEFDTALKGQTYHFTEANISRYTNLKRMVICPCGKLQAERQPQFLLDLTADSTAMQVKIDLVRRQIKTNAKEIKVEAKSGKSPAGDIKPLNKSVILNAEERKLIDQVAAVMTNYLWLKACI